MRTKAENIEMIKQFSNANGVSGFEDEVVSLAKKYAPQNSVVKEDHLRNTHLSNKTNTEKTACLD